MRNVVVENWDTGKEYGVFSIRKTAYPDYLNTLAKRLKMKVSNDYYDDGMISKTRYFLLDKDGVKYRVYLLAQ